MGFRLPKDEIISYLSNVSIPKRGFGGFSRKSILAGIAKIGVSIPKRGFGGFSRRHNLSTVS